MTPAPDSELLATFARTNSEAAFAELVRRHVNLVYSAALRQVQGDTHLAQDVAQTVFADLARKAASLARRESLAGWLYTSAHFAAAKIIRTETRRRDREENFMREPSNEPSPEADWEQVRPTLDRAMHELKEADREAILLRYFENRPFAEVGTRLGLNENAARMRVDRALEKLRVVLARQGVAVTATLASVISAHAVQVAPASLATTLTAAALAGVGTGTFTFLKIMTAAQFKLGISALVVAGAAAVLVLEQQTQQKLHGENESLTQQLAGLESDNQNLSNQLAAAGSSKPLSSEQLIELLKLRGEAGLLKSQLAAARAQVQAAARSRSAQPAPDSDPAVEQRRIQIHKLNNTKYLAMAAMFGLDHQDAQFPTNWTQVASFYDEMVRRYIKPGDPIPDTATDFKELTSLFDLAYQGAIGDLQGATNLQDIIVVRERQPLQMLDGRWIKFYGFADGHASYNAEPPEGFDAYEQKHMLVPGNQ